MVYIYILLLEQNKYYIGKTNKPKFRIDCHFNSRINSNTGSVWTRMYKPIKILKIIPDCDDYDEDKYTIMYMNKYGMNNVRGGSFCSIVLDENTIEQIKRMCNGANNNCFICGSSEHFAINCDNKENDTDFTLLDFTKEDEHEYYKENNCCYRCGRSGHYIDSCYARTHITGYEL